MLLSPARIGECVTAVCTVRRVTMADIKGPSRCQPIVHYRQEAMALAREMTGRSLPAIGRYLGDRDHTTVLFGIRQIARRQQEDPAYAADLEQIRHVIREIIRKRVQSIGCSSKWSPAPPKMPLLRPSQIRVTMGAI